MEALKQIFLHKISLRIIYIGAAYTTSYFVALAGSPKVTAFLSKSGILFQVTDPMKFKAQITMLLLFGGEFVYHFFHEKFILPHVDPVLKPIEAPVIVTPVIEIPPIQ